MPPDPSVLPLGEAGAGDEANLLDRVGHELGLSLSAQQIQQLLWYRNALLKWNKVYNLTSVREPGEMLRLHLIDCLAIVPAVQRRLAELHLGASAGQGNDTRSLRILDVGSGGGLPGVVLAICLPEAEVHCVDAVGKKVAFVRQVAAELRLPKLRALHLRVEQHQPPQGAGGDGYDLITSRAFASLADFTDWTAHLLAPEGVWMAMKGQEPHDELREPGLWAQVFHVEQVHPPGLEAQRCLIWLKRTGPGQDGAPQD